MPRCTVNVSSQSFVSDEQCRAVVCQRSRKAAHGHRPSVLIPATGGDSDRSCILLRPDYPKKVHRVKNVREGAKREGAKKVHRVKKEDTIIRSDKVKKNRYVKESKKEDTTIWSNKVKKNMYVKEQFTLWGRKFRPFRTLD